MALVVAMGALVLWLGLDFVEWYIDRTDALVDRVPPEQAVAMLQRDMKVFAIIQVLPLLAFCAFMLWYARRAMDTHSLPPTGSWIVEGQRIRTGDDAIRRARLIFALAVVLLLVSAWEAVYVWRLASNLVDIGNAATGKWSGAAMAIDLSPEFAKRELVQSVTDAG